MLRRVCVTKNVQIAKSTTAIVISSLLMNATILMAKVPKAAFLLPIYKKKSHES